ncbi:hypothetical protein K440DRAFT_610832 [Wilcoxina mikolae CBS 423.85]|nr:hypothetical protein K440DRAFT_610832 [Wilcoxina mikolae CBS 423.85]
MLDSQDIAPRYWKCVESFSRLLELLGDNGSETANLKPLEDEFGRFRVWGENSGSHRKGRASLDHRLREASNVKQTVLELLEDLDSDLNEAITIVSGETVDNDAESLVSGGTDSVEGDDGILSESEARPENDPPSELKECIIDIAHVITCLYEFSIAIRNPAPRDRLEKCSAIDVSHFELFDIQHVQHKFPHAHEDLQERLGKANTKRRQLFQYHERHHEKISGRYNHSEPPGPVTVAKPHEQVDRTRDLGLDQEDQDAVDRPLTIATTRKTQTTVSTYVPRQPTTSDTASETAHSQTSYSTSVGGLDSTQGPRLMINVPPPPNPESTLSGKPFPCPYCFSIISVSGSRLWRRHVFQDLRPYVCTFRDCAMAGYLFSSQHDWFEHETELHRREWFCNGCRESYSSASSFRQHLQNKHQDLVEPSQLETTVNRCERVMESEQPCPLCPLKEEGFPTFLPGRLQRHLGNHMQQLALFVTKPFQDEDNDRDVGSISLGELVNASKENSEEASQKSALEFDSDTSEGKGPVVDMQKNDDEEGVEADLELGSPQIRPPSIASTESVLLLSSIRNVSGFSEENFEEPPQKSAPGLELNPSEGKGPAVDTQKNDDEEDGEADLELGSQQSQPPSIASNASVIPRSLTNTSPIGANAAGGSGWITDDLVATTSALQTNGVDSLAVHAIVSDISSNSEDEQWENLLGAAPKTLGCIAQCFIVALDGHSGTITQSKDGSIPSDLRINLINCSDLGLEAFRKAESKASSIATTIGEITEPFGVLDEILETIGEISMHEAVQEAATSTDLAEQLEKLRVLAATCTTDSGSVVETFSEWQGLAKRINSAFTETHVIETINSEGIDNKIAKTEESQGLFKRTIRRVVGGQSSEEVRSDLQKLNSKKTEKVRRLYPTMV